MFARSLPLARGRARRAHYLFAASLFGILGFHVGVWAVQLAPLSAGLGLDPAALGIAPVVPSTLSLAGRSAPGRSGQAVATTTAAGYSAFIVSPLTIGLLAQATSLRLALALLIPTSLAIAGLATRWPAVMRN